MSGGLKNFTLSEDDATKLLMAKTHLGTKNVNFQMTKYVSKRRADGVNIINIHKTWEKLVLAARIIVTVENPQDVSAISGRTFGQRAVLKFSKQVGATPVAGRYTPGTFTNQIQKAFREPRLLIVTDPRVDHQSVREASYGNIPVIAIANTDAPLRYVDVAIPANNSSVQSVGLLWWFLAREVLRLRGNISREAQWDVMPDLYFYRDPEAAEKEEASAPKAIEAAEAPTAEDWGTAPAAAAAPAAAPADAAPADWSAAPAGGDWSSTTSAWDQTA